MSTTLEIENQYTTMDKAVEARHFDVTSSPVILLSGSLRVTRQISKFLEMVLLAK